MSHSGLFIHDHGFFMALHWNHSWSFMVIFFTVDLWLIIHDHDSDESHDSFIKMRDRNRYVLCSMAGPSL